MITKVFNSINPKNRIIENNPLIDKYGVEILSTPFVFDNSIDFEIDIEEKHLIIKKLLEAHELALINVKAGNITKRGFATNVCTQDNYWSIGTNFNNTRNDISSVCGERSAILASYNEALLRYSKNPVGAFVFKIKYLCMASNIDLKDIKETIAPCEDCLSWLNTNKYFDFNTLIFSFERDENNELIIKASKLTDFLPYKNLKTSTNYSQNKEIKYTKNAYQIYQKLNIKKEDIISILEKNISLYKNNQHHKTSGQNIVCSIVSNNKIYSSQKIDWTKRWNTEPLENCATKAIEENGLDARISLVSYFGDEAPDNLVSIKSLGRIRQKYANNDTLLVLNFESYILITTIGEYLPKKFKQGYKIS